MPKKNTEQVGVRIPIGTRYLLTSDPNNWTISIRQVNSNKKSADYGKEYFVPTKFYPTLPAVINGLLELNLKGSEATSLKELREAVDKFKAEFEPLLTLK